MNINVSEKAAAQVEKWVSDGDYPDPQTAIQTAITVLAKVRDQERVWKSVLAADVSINEGHGIPYSEIDWDALWESSRAKAAHGHIPDPDVTPD